MKLVTFTHDGRTRIGALVSKSGQGYVLDLHSARLPADMIEFLSAGETVWALAKNIIAAAEERFLLPQAEVTLLAPVPRPGKIICLGHNYRDHMGDATLPEYPTFFGKYANTVIGPGQPIVIPRVTDQVDFEAELGVVIGQRVRYVQEDRALACVAGYVAFNDVTARDYVRRSSQWMLGKTFDTFGPMGPALVTTDEIPDPSHLELSLTLNDQVMQHSNTGNLIFSIPFLIVCLSEVMTLEPGDVIVTGTPSGTGASRKPPIFMKPGDMVKIRIEKIGELANPVVAEAQLAA